MASRRSPKCKQSSAKLPLLPPVQLPPHNGRSVCLQLPLQELQLHGQALILSDLSSSSPLP